jgi:hypothetical protein
VLHLPLVGDMNHDLLARRHGDGRRLDVVEPPEPSELVRGLKLRPSSRPTDKAKLISTSQ